MSNRNDPNPNKPQEQPQQPTDQPAVNRSTFEFALPEGIESLSDIPLVPPEEADSTFVNKAAVPPRPNTLRPTTNTFDFLVLPEAEMGPLSGGGLQNVEAMPTPVEPGLEPPVASDSTVGLSRTSDADPTTFQLGGSGLDLGVMPHPVDLLPPPPSSQMSVPDIATLFPPDPTEEQSVATSSSGSAESSDSAVSLLNPGSMPAMELPPVDAGSNIFPAPASAHSGTGDSSLESEEPLSEQRPTTPTPIGDWLLPEEPVATMGGGRETTGSTEPSSAPTTSSAARSSGDFELPEASSATGEATPPQADRADNLPAAVPMVPQAATPSDSFDSISYPKAVQSAEQLSPSTASHSSSAGAEPASPVAPVADWIDADAADVPSPAPVRAPSSPVESSDIFSGGTVPTAEPVEHSDVIAATAYGQPSSWPEQPSELLHPSESTPSQDRLLKEALPAEPGSAELPIAREAGSSHEFPLPIGDSTSIHDLPDPQAVDLLFDSAHSGLVPDVPPPPVSLPEEVPDYGQSHAETEEASSILADLSNPELTMDSAGAGSELRSSENSHGPMFELTVPESPFPPGLFEESTEGLSAAMANIPTQPDSDLFAKPRSQPEINLGSTPESEHPSQSSIFSSEPVQDEPSDLHQAASTEQELDLVNWDAGDVAEFTDEPELNKTVERDPEKPPVAPTLPTQRLPYGLSSSDFELAAESAGSTEEATPQTGTLSELMKSLGDDSGENPTKDFRALEEPPADPTSEPVVTVDWMAGSAEGPAIHDPSRTDPEFGSRTFEQPVQKLASSAEATFAARVVPKASPRGRDSDTGSEEVVSRSPGDTSDSVEKLTPRRASAKSGSGLVLGGLLGGVLASVACAGIYVSGLVPNQERVSNQPPPQPPQMPVPPLPPGLPAPPGDPQPPTLDAKTAFALGDWTKALELAQNADTVEAKATAGRIRVYAKIRGVATDADLQQAQADLREVIAASDQENTAESRQRAIQATVDLGISHEATGDFEAAKKLFTEAKEKYKDHAAIFEALLDRLTSPPADAGGRQPAPQPTPAELTHLAFSVSVLFQQDGPKSEEAPEPGIYYWKAIKLARERRYQEAVELIGHAKAAHLRRAQAFAGRGLNPLTDPLEQMFPTACDELAALWKEFYRQPALADAIQKQGLGKTLESLATAKTDLAKAQADAKRALDQLDTTKGELKKAQEELKKNATLLESTTAELKKTQDNLSSSTDKLKKLETDLTDATKELTRIRDSLKKLETEKAQAAEAALALRKDLQKTTDEKNATVAELAQLHKDLAQIAAAIAPAVKLPEKWTAADLSTAVKNLAALANDKEMKTLLERLTKAESEAKAATEKLSTETQRLTEQYETALKKLTTRHTAELKTLKDDYTAQITKLKETNAAEVKKLMEKYDDDLKKMLAQHQLTIKKLTDEHRATLQAEQAKREAEQKAAAVKVATVEKQLANVITPAQALDIWLPVLTDLRRASDADSALEIAKRSLASSLPDSEEAAKARTVQGMAFLLKGEYAKAQEEFLAARRSPAFAEDKPWAKVVENGLEAIHDPLALYRQPVVTPAVDSKLAVRALDAGIAAYRAGRYPAAEQALLEAAKNDPADPVAWYYLGAARWALGQTEQARKDFQQGAEREKVSPQPARIINTAIAPIQGEVRDQLDRVRP